MELTCHEATLNSTMATCFNRGNCTTMYNTGCHCQYMYAPEKYCEVTMHEAQTPWVNILQIIAIIFSAVLLALTVLEIILDIYLRKAKYSWKKPLFICKCLFATYLGLAIAKYVMEFTQSIQLDTYLEIQITAIVFLYAMPVSTIYTLLVVSWVTLLSEAATLSETATIWIIRFRLGVFITTAIVMPFRTLMTILGLLNIQKELVNGLDNLFAAIFLLVVAVSSCYLLRALFWLRKLKSRVANIARVKTYWLCGYTTIFLVLIGNLVSGVIIPQYARTSIAQLIGTIITDYITHIYGVICMFMYLEKYFTIGYIRAFRDGDSFSGRTSTNKNSDP